MEYMKNGSLHDYMMKNLLNDEALRQFFRDLILGLEYCHESANIIHFDIKVDNLLLDENNNLKISDFGISQIFQNNDDLIKSNKFGSPFYMAPELTVKNSSFHGKPIDIWSSGIVLYYMVYMNLPFYVGSSNEILNLYELIRNKQYLNI